MSLGLVGRCARAGVVVAATTLVALVGCASAPPEPDPEPSPEQVACDDFCTAAADVGCPQRGDCNADCLVIAKLGCVDLFADLLKCAGDELTHECVPRDGSGGLGCTAELAGYDSCLPVDVGTPLDACSPSTAESLEPSAGCHGELACGATTFTVDCDAAGACSCAKDGAMLGTCDAILSSAYLCAPHRSCCAPFFAPVSK